MCVYVCVCVPVRVSVFDTLELEFLPLRTDAIFFFCLFFLLQ